jgi:hypothetical protein
MRWLFEDPPPVAAQIVRVTKGWSGIKKAGQGPAALLKYS